MRGLGILPIQDVFLLSMECGHMGQAMDVAFRSTGHLGSSAELLLSQSSFAHVHRLVSTEVPSHPSKETDSPSLNELHSLAHH